MLHAEERRARRLSQGKRKKGSKTHIAVDTLGFLLTLHVTPASAKDRGEVERLARTVWASPACGRG